MSHRRGLTVIELVITLLWGTAGFLTMIMYGGGPMGRARASNQQLKCATQVRATVQAMMVFANGNRDLYPIPSRLDKSDATIAGGGDAKNTQANILSILVFNGSIAPEMLVSPAEVNPSVKVHTTYTFANPQAAAKPDAALWDPSLSVDFTTGDPQRPAHNSYAMMTPDAQHIKAGVWGNTFNANEVVLGNRGPQIDIVENGRATTKLNNSNTFRIHGPKETWEGNIAYNDSHVNFETSLISSDVTYRTRGNKTRADCFFHDEMDDAKGLNAYLTVFPAAGTSPEHFKRIWD